MANVKVLILRAPGTNCDVETQFAFELAGASCERVHINRLLEQPDLFDSFQVLCISGGFSFGDDIGAGRILAAEMQQRLGDALAKFRDDDKLMLGICNGFQVLLNSRLFETNQASSRDWTLTWNDSGRFENRWVDLKVHNDHCVFLKGIEHLYLPVANAEGKFVGRNEQSLEDLDGANKIALTYCDPDGTNGSGKTKPFPINPNGSVRNIAGLCDATGRILGLMPHPERNVDPTHHPRWTRQPQKSPPDGRAIFQNAVSYFN
jgi:phosphoribosylformylglycinamidine synthase